jgi:FAD/FMN-containing dehydrogenase
MGKDWQAAGAETGGEVLFDAASRGRYSTDASIYQVEPVGVFVPRTERDVELAIAIAREMGVPDPAARRRHQPVRPDRGRSAGHRQQQIPERRCSISTRPP